jgi:polyhydroxybutyrate depolymerase
VADELGFVYVFADGATDAFGARSWRATDACCERAGREDDDVTFLRDVVERVQRLFPIDRARIYVAGFSNGGFMAHRLGCDAPMIAALVSVSGAQWDDPTRCRPTHPVSVLQVHGARDATVKYEGGMGTFSRLPYPSAMKTVETWASLNGCTPTLSASAEAVELSGEGGTAVANVAGATGCPAGVDVQLWTLPEGGHGIDASHKASVAVARFLLAHHL